MSEKCGRTARLQSRRSQISGGLLHPFISTSVPPFRPSWSPQPGHTSPLLPKINKSIWPRKVPLSLGAGRLAHWTCGRYRSKGFWEKRGRGGVRPKGPVPHSVKDRTPCCVSRSRGCLCWGAGVLGVWCCGGGGGGAGGVLKHRDTCTATAASARATGEHEPWLFCRQRTGQSGDVR